MDFTRLRQLIPDLDHPNILPIEDVVSDQNMYYVVTPYIDGETLRDRLHKAQTALEPGVAVDVVTQVAAALDHLHGAGIVHLDVTPVNIMIAADGRVLLTNFFHAARLDEVQGGPSGEVRGTLAYMSPEQIEGRELSGRSDVYSLGVVAFEMLAGRLPFWGSSAELTQKHLSAAPPAPSSFNPYLTEDFDAVVLKALAKDPAQRHASAGAFASDMRAVLEKARGGRLALDDGVTQPILKSLSPPQDRAPVDDSLRQGQAFGEGRYEVIEQVARGGMLTAFKAHDWEANRIVLVVRAPIEAEPEPPLERFSPVEDTPPAEQHKTRGLDFTRSAPEAEPATGVFASDEKPDEKKEEPPPTLMEDVMARKEEAGLLRHASPPEPEPETEATLPARRGRQMPSGRVEEADTSKMDTLVGGKREAAARDQDDEAGAEMAEEESAGAAPAPPSAPAPEASASLDVQGDVHGDVEVAGGHIIKTNGGNVVVFENQQQALKYEKQARRFDTAFPDKVAKGQTAVLWVSVSKPGDPPPFEGVPAGTIAHGPTADIPLPVDPATGKLQEVHIDVQVRAPQYEPSKDSATLTVHPDGKPDKVRFLLEAQDEGKGIVLVQFYLDKKRLGEVELSSVVEKARAGAKLAFSLQVASLYLAFGVA